MGEPCSSPPHDAAAAVTWLLTSRLGRALAALGAVLVALVAAFASGRIAGHRAAGEREQGRYRNTRKDMDDADVSHGDPDADLEWLHERAER